MTSTTTHPDKPNPQKRNIAIQKLSRAPWWVLIIASLILGFVIILAENSLYRSAWSQVRQGIWTTLWVTLVAYAAALTMGLILALMRRPSRSLLYNLFVYQFATAYVEIIRGIPTLVLVLYIVAAGVPQFVKQTNRLGQQLQEREISALGLTDEMIELRIRDIPEVYRAIIALAVSYSAFVSEIFRAGLNSIERGQRDAAQSLGMSRWQVLRLVVLPQAFRNVLPPLANDFIALLKESSLVSVVGVEDITRQGRNFNASAFLVFPGYNVIALTYLTMTLSLSILVKGMESYLNRGQREES